MIKAVPQTYAGTRFRSTLEADWAATLDALRVQWRYEPEAIELPSGTLYRPDFWLPELRCWLEVKGPGVPGLFRANELALSAPVVLGRPAIRGMCDWELISRDDNGLLEDLNAVLGLSAGRGRACPQFAATGSDWAGRTCLPFVRAPR